jgi:hypothetical protein
MYRFLILILSASCAVDSTATTGTSDVVVPDASTTCGLPMQCQPWSASTAGPNLLLDRNWAADWQCTIACEQPAQCPGRISSGCLVSCAPLRDEAWAFCEASCYNLVRTTCVFSLGDP